MIFGHLLVNAAITWFKKIYSFSGETWRFQKSSSEPREPFSLLRQMTFIWRGERNGLRIIPRSYCYFGHVMVLKNILLQEKGLDNTKTLCGSPDTLCFVSETAHIFDGLFSCSKLLLVVVRLYGWIFVNAAVEKKIIHTRWVREFKRS